MQPKILLFDLENSPNLAFTWGKYEQDTLGDMVQRRKVISISWKWFHKKTFHVASVPDFYGYKFHWLDIPNKKLIEKIHSLFCAADILVAQNGDNFDIKMANAEFIQHGLTPTPPHKTVDTLKIARSKFKLNSNKLDDVGESLGLGRKLKHPGFDMWVGCMKGDRASWKIMKEYNKQDVVLLEKVYVKLRPWMTNHPNMNVLDGKGECTVCRSTRMMKRGWHLTNMGRRQQWKCLDCGKWSLGVLVQAGLTLRP